MRKILLMLCAVSLLAVGCKKEGPTGNTGGNGDNTGGNGGNTDTPALVLDVTGIENNQATITATGSGGVVSIKIIDNILRNDVSIDIDSDLKLSMWVDENGVAASLPYNKTLEGLPSNREFLTAAVGCNASGQAVCSAYKVWTSVGAESGWGEDSSAGNLEDNTLN